MFRFFDITLKDLLQLRRDRKVFMFLLIMPIIFTLLFGYAFGGIGGGGGGDSRLPVGFIDQERTWLTKALRQLLDKSTVVRMIDYQPADQTEMEDKISTQKLAAGVILPSGYMHTMLQGRPAKLTLIADVDTNSGMTIQSEVFGAANRLFSAVQTALILEREAGENTPFTYAFDQAIKAWDEPPIRINETTSSAIRDLPPNKQALAHFSPGMMLQFAIAGLLTAAQILVEERKTRSLQRMLSTTVPRTQILLGHFLSIFVMIFIELLVLTTFGQLVLGVRYWVAPLATLLVSLASALCVAALGLLVGVFARSDEQATIFALLMMFIFSGLGGAWVPLEEVGATFRAVGHLTPIAWAMDGFQSIVIRGLGVQAVLLPCAALVGYMVLFWVLAGWRFARLEER
jgi:ABC-2 type transport system permease protein